MAVRGFRVTWDILYETVSTETRLTTKKIYLSESHKITLSIDPFIPFDYQALDAFPA
jgi:hypothetical protein